VDILVFEDRVGQAELGGVGADEAQRRLGGLLHDVAELAGQDQSVFAFHGGGLHEQDVAAELGPGQAGDDSGVEVRTLVSPVKARHT